MPDNRPPYRTIKTAIDLRTLVKITSDELLAMNRDDYNVLRRIATRSRLESAPAYACAKCGYGVYAPLSGMRHQPYWRHFKGAPKNCPWYTGEPTTIDQISGQQFQGAQESPLHFKLKTEIAEILKLDRRASEVIVDKYILSEHGRRRPDVRANFDGKQIAIEIQLAHTQIPIILQREQFYAANGIHLIWMTWCFEPEPIDNISQTILDVYFSQKHNLFSLDDEYMKSSRANRRLIFQAFQENEGEWNSRTVSLSELTWTNFGLPYAFPEPIQWRKEWITTWCDASNSQKTDYQVRQKLLQQTIDKLALRTTVSNLEVLDVPSLLNCLFSFGFHKPIGSRQTNLVEVTNTFLNYTTTERHRYAEIVRTAIVRSQNDEILNRESVAHKIKHALTTSAQETLQDTVGRLVLAIFPKWFQAGFWKPGLE